MLHQDMVKCRVIIERDNEALENSIKKKSYNYPCQKTTSVLYKARQINTLINRTRQFFHTILETHKIYPWAQSAFAYNDLLVSRVEQDVLRQKFTIFRDSLNFLLTSDRALAQQISEACIINEEILNSARTDQKVMYILGLELRLLALVHQALISLEAEVTVKDPMPDRVLPAIALEAPCIKAGKPFLGEIYGIHYSSQYDTMLRFFANNQPLPNEGGIGKLKLSTKGLNQKLEVSVQMKHPFEDSYEKVVKKIPFQNLCKN